MREPTDRGKMIDDERTMSVRQSEINRAETPVNVDFQDKTNRSNNVDPQNSVLQPETNGQP